MDYAAAEKIAMELIEQRRSFYKATLSNAIGSAPDAEKPRIIALMGQI